VVVSSAETGPGMLPAGPGSGRRLGYRWTTVALLFAALTVNYVDRQVLGILAPTFTRELHWSETDYSTIVSLWSVAYGVGLYVMGRIMDRVGVRRGLAGAVLAWSLAAMAHALAFTVRGFGIARVCLGLAEAGNFPAAQKSVAEWFPKRERAFAFGIFNAGSNVGVILATLMVPWIALALGWRWAFVATGLLDLVFLGVWLAIYRAPEGHRRVTPAEMALIRSDPPEPQGKVPYRSLFNRRQTWAFIVGKAMTDPVWLFYLFWLPKFLDARWGVQLSRLALPLIVIYLAADVGSVMGGWTSSALIKRGWSINSGRKVTMLLAAVCIVPTIFAPSAGSLWMAIAIVSVAAAAHQWWSANLYTLVSDMFPRQLVGTVTGIGGSAGLFAAFFFQRATGSILETTGGNYAPVFAVLGFAYVSALLIVHLLVPHLEPAAIPSAAGAEGR